MVRSLSVSAGDVVGTVRGGTVWLAEDGSEASAYLTDPSTASALPGVSLVRLERSLDIAGAAQGHDAAWHYVVLTDVLPAMEAEFNAWYDTEHLPGLAAVPGVVRACRARVVEGTAPIYHASYELAQLAAFNGPAWLAVRSTPWSSRVRPAFLNTRRTMYRRFP